MHDNCRNRFPLGNRVHLETLSRDPYPVLKALQEHEPVSWVPEAQAWFVTRRADCLSILLDSATFSVASPASLLEDTLDFIMVLVRLCGNSWKWYRSKRCFAEWIIRIAQSEKTSVESQLSLRKQG